MDSPQAITMVARDYVGHYHWGGISNADRPSAGFIQRHPGKHNDGSPCHDRQGRAVNAALAALGRANARAFLNTHHQGLRGCPLDLAVARDSGLTAVEAALCVEARRGLESC